MNESLYRLNHLFPLNTASKQKFISPRQVRHKYNLPPRNRLKHYQNLKSQINSIASYSRKIGPMADVEIYGLDSGINIVFKSELDFDLKFESLELQQYGVELLSVKTESGVTFASVFVPDGKLKYFINKLEKYGAEEKNKALIESISEIRIATIEALWTDKTELFPQPEEIVWLEIWLRSALNSGAIVRYFREKAGISGLIVGQKALKFADRTVLLVKGTLNQIASSVDVINCVAEIRKAKDIPSIFLSLSYREQEEYVEDVLSRQHPSGNDELSICVLDTGVNNRHPLIQPHLSTHDMHTYEPSWMVNDSHGHGTQMAGLAVYGDLFSFLIGSDILHVSYILESVKILPPNGENDPKLYGQITLECADRPRVIAPHRKRIYAMAVTAKYENYLGLPSSWSAAIDKYTSGAEDGECKLFIMSVGNINSHLAGIYPSENILNQVENPAQSWNALSIGAFTQKTEINQEEFPGFEPIAPSGDLSPTSRTSINWDKQWPFKPDVVFEGGNYALLNGGEEVDCIDDLQLLTTHHIPQNRHFTTTGDTSAATYLAAKFAAQLQSKYPNLWPESIRALMIHSSEWTPSMIQRWHAQNGRKQYEKLLRYCGYGVPNIIKAINSAQNDLCLIMQDSLYPFDKENNRYVTKDMHIHSIPWPVEVLESLDTEISMKVTLSYFIEPNPAQRGWGKRYRYASHGLRFDVKTPTESLDQFKIRINKAARDEGEKAQTSSDSGQWQLGSQLRSRGSIHSDIWTGTAVELAQRGHIAVYPISGWWKEKHRLGFWDKPARYSLVISISTPETDIDLYTSIASMISIQT